MQQERRLELRVADGMVAVTVAGWRGFRLGPGGPRLVVSGKTLRLALERSRRPAPGTLELTWHHASGLVLTQTLTRETPTRWRGRGTLTNQGRRTWQLDRVDLWAAGGKDAVALGRQPGQVRVLENTGYVGQVRSLAQIMTGADSRKALDGTHGGFYSEAVTVLDSRADGCSLLLGFETFFRFNGSIRAASRKVQGQLAAALANVDPASQSASELNLAPVPDKLPGTFTEFTLGCGGGGIPMPPGATVELEELVLEAGADPFQLLDDYAERVARRYDLKDLPAPFANWCSWYPYRLGVDEAKVLATAAAAKARHLDRLGLRFIQVDLGWEKHNIPTYFEENERFPHGLRWLATRLEEYGFELGVWKGFACVSENHELAREHPEWLVHKDDGSLADCGTWFWEPHDRIYVLDITHPGAQEWVSRNIASLAARGVRYLKWDFGGCLNVGGRRHDPAIACAGALEGMRLASGLVNEAFGDGLVLDCTATETANLGHFKMIYTNWDTGNTGIGIRHLRWTTTTAATHLFKNRRWALLQPSCLVVGLPGATEEARIRATVTFLFGGHTDISDTLAALPEERWRILLATLPPLPTRARAADLFHPLAISQGSDVALCQGKALPPATTCDPQGALVWHAPVRTDWDEWELVALFHLFERVVNGASQALSLRFQLPFTALGLDPARTFWAYEFWNEQALGTIPVPARPQGCYRHPGDYAALINDGRPGWLDLTCHGPAVKLLVLRRPRPHPWPLSTTFHLSGGLELSGVQWQPATRTLSGCLQRPPGEQGRIIIGGVAADQAVEAGVGDAVVPVGRLPNAAVSLPVLTQSWETPWSLRLG